jgi:hypothetical protein
MSEPEEHAARIERLLGDVRASVGPVAWRRIEELVSRLVALYGAALGRALFLVEEAGVLDATLRARLAGDELVGAMLALHGMHPDPPLERARVAVERVRAHLGEAAGGVDLVLDDRDLLTITLTGDWRRCAVPRAAVDETLRHAIEEAAPEVVTIAIGGVDWDDAGPAPPAPPAPLVQLDLLRSRSGSGTVR